MARRAWTIVLAGLVLAGCAGRRGPEDLGPQVTEIARFETDQPTGVAASRSGRVFVCFPRWHERYHRLHVAEINASGDFAAYPNLEWNRRIGDVEATPEDHFVCVQSVHVDDQNRLWALDTGSPPATGLVEGGAKLVQIDLSTNQVVRTIAFDRAIAPRGSYLNDVRIDTDSGFAFISDSGLGAIVVVNLADGSARRMLWSHDSTKADPNLELGIHGAPLKNAQTGQTPQIHCDGIALDAEGGWLYYQALTGTTLYRVPTAPLMDWSMEEEALVPLVENLGTTVVTDGMILDDQKNLYFTAIELDAVIVRPAHDPDELVVYVKSPFLSWPDSYAISPQGELYVTTSQIHLTPWFRLDGRFPDTPYQVFKMDVYRGE